MPAGQAADVCVIPRAWVSVKTRRRLSRLLGGIGPVLHGAIFLRFAATAPNRERGHVARRRLPNNLEAPTGSRLGANPQLLLRCRHRDARDLQVDVA